VAQRRKIAGRSKLAQAAHFRTGAGAMGGDRRQQARRKRRRDRQEERQEERQVERQAERRP